MSQNRVRDFFGLREIKNYKLTFRQLLSEFLGSLLYLSLVLHAGIGIRNYKGELTHDVLHGTGTILIALSNGLMVASIVAIFGHISGGHVNPAVTLGTLICGHIKPIKAVCYIIVQIIGSIAGAGIAYLLSSETIRGNLGAILPYQNLRQDQVFGLEFLMTFVLVAVFLSVIDTTRGARGLGSSPLAVGLALAAGIACCSPYTLCMNPIRSFGPALIMGIWDSHWVYWVGPMLGGLVAGLLYRFVLVYGQHTIVLQASRSDVYRGPDNARTE